VFLIALPDGANAVLGGGKDRDNCQGAFDGIEKQLQTEALGAFANSNSPSHTTFTNFSLKYQIFVEKAVWYRLCEGQAVLAADWQNENNEGVVFKNALNFAMKSEGLSSDKGDLPHDSAEERILNAKIQEVRENVNTVNRTISGAFLKKVLVSNLFDVPGFNYIHIEHASIVGDVDLNNEILRSSLILRDCLFWDEVNLSYFRTEHNIDLTGSSFVTSLTASRMWVGGSVLLSSEYIQQNATNKSVGKQQAAVLPALVKTPNASSESPYNDEGHGSIHRAYFSKINLSRSVIAGDLRIRNVDFYDDANFFGIEVGKTMELRNSTFNYMQIDAASIGKFEVIGSEFIVPDEEDPQNLVFSAASLTVVNNLDLIRLRVAGGMDLSSTKVGGSLRLEGLRGCREVLQKPMNVNMNGVAIAGDLRVGPAPLPPQSSTSLLDQSSLYCEQSAEETQGGKPVDMARLDKRQSAESGHPRGAVAADLPKNVSEQQEIIPMEWSPDSSMHLTHSNIGVIRTDFEERSWPGRLYLSGVTLNGFGMPYNYPASPDSPNIIVGFKTISKWLENVRKQLEFGHDPSVYKAMRAVFINSGQMEDAKMIAIEGKNMEKELAWQQGHYNRNLTLNAQNLLIGYGFALERTVFWALLLTAIGAIVFRSTTAWVTLGKPRGFSYSFDMLLPLIRLRGKHYDVDLEEEPQRVYFYIHKLLGYLIGFYLVAGLSGAIH